MAESSTALEWHALYDDYGEGEPWVAYVEGHHDLFALAAEAEAEIRKAFPLHETTISQALDTSGGAALSHFWLKRSLPDCENPEHPEFFVIAKCSDPGAFPVTGVRFS